MGETDYDPLRVTEPMLWFIEAVLALVELQVSTVVLPIEILAGDADIVQVGGLDPPPKMIWPGA